MQIGKGKQGVLIGEYRGPLAHDRTVQVKNPPQEKDQNAVLGYIEPACDNPQWILWFTRQGDAILHQKRSETGAILDKALTIKGQSSKKNEVVFKSANYFITAGRVPKPKN
jgi:ABC-type enterochelin transport system substrate-binding protein